MSEAVVLASAQHLIERGYRGIVLRMYANGHGWMYIRNFLLNEHGVDVTVRIIRRFCESYGKREQVMSLAAQRDMEDLRQMAEEDIRRFREAYWAAEDLKTMEHLEGAYGRWWDRMGKFYLPNQGTLQQAAQINILIADPKVLVREEVRNADDAARILARLESAEAPGKPDTGVKRAENAARPEEAPGSQ